MTRLDRILKLLEDYDDALEYYLDDENMVGYITLKRLRIEKDQLTKELIEHGCRRKN